ncbi:MAG: phytoene desaturase family protein [Pyrinomonadaceae bacterium]
MSVIIVGAGLGGLSAAIHLASRGVKVCVLEKNERVGGKVNIVCAAGYSFDTGASLLTMRHVLEDLFRAADRRLEDYLQLTALDIICRYRWSDGATLDASTDWAETERGIARIAPADARNFRRFLDDSRRKYEVAARTFLAHSLNDLPQLLRPRYARDLAAISSWRTLDQHVGRYFSSPRVRQLFNRFATYNGSSPYRVPATFALIPYVEFGLGAWYAQGGIYEIPRALRRLAIELGVVIVTCAEVEEILIEGGRARGVRLKGGETRRAEAVISNADAIETYRRLIPPASRRVYHDGRIARVEPSCSGFVLLLGTRRRYEQLAHHNIFFSKDYAAEFRAIFDDLRPARDPTIYVCAASRTDATQAPPGHENLFVLVNAPATSSRTCWATETKAYRDLIIGKLESFGLDGLSASIDFEMALAPDHFQETYGAFRGSIYGTSSNNWMSAFLRPPNKARDIDGLYFAGGATHPGGGMPLVLLSGRMAADLALKWDLTER